MDDLVKPIGSLGLLEEYAVRLAGIFGKTNVAGLKKAVAVFAADNGVWDEGITSVPQGVTAMQTINMTKGVTGVTVFAAAAGADVFIYDMGIRGFAGVKGVENRRVGDGTRSIAKAGRDGHRPGGAGNRPRHRTPRRRSGIRATASWAAARWASATPRPLRRFPPC